MSQRPFLAYILPISDGRPDHELPGQPPGIWGPNDPRPGYGLPEGPGGKPPSGRPPGTWGGAGEPFPGYGLPGGGQGRPPGTWGGSGENMPGNPIVLPPVNPGGPPVIWGPNDPRPGLGPVVPPPPPPMDTAGKPPPPEGGWGYSPKYGWGFFPSPSDPQPKK